jgi:hypothetical protein
MNGMSNQPSKGKAREEDFWDPDRVDRVFKSLGSFGSRPIGGWGLLFKHTPYHILFKKMNKVYTAARNSTIKYQARLEACQSRIKAIPENATIRKEYVKCKKHNCHRKHHGPYYYAYWKDPDLRN